MSYKEISPKPVDEGGTGVQSNTAYAVLCGGTTATGAIQSIASVGTANQVLTSNGAGALPTFQNSSATPTTLIQQVRTNISSSTYTTATIHPDGTVPQKSEGTQLVTLNITPTSASSILVFDFNSIVYASGSVSNFEVTYALFQDSDSSAIAGTVCYISNQKRNNAILKHSMTAGTTGAITFKIRFGAWLSTGITSNSGLGSITTGMFSITEYSS